MKVRISEDDITNQYVKATQIVMKQLTTKYSIMLSSKRRNYVARPDDVTHYKHNSFNIIKIAICFQCLT